MQVSLEGVAAVVPLNSGDWKRVRVWSLTRSGGSMRYFGP